MLPASSICIQGPILTGLSLPATLTSQIPAAGSRYLEPDPVHCKSVTSESNSYFLALSLLSSSWTDHRLSKHGAVLHQPDSAASLSPPLASPPPPLHPGIPHFTRCPHLPHRPHPAETQTWSLSPDPGGLSPLWGRPPPQIPALISAGAAGNPPSLLSILKGQCFHPSEDVCHLFTVRWDAHPTCSPTVSHITFRHLYREKGHT